MTHTRDSSGCRQNPEVEPTGDFAEVSFPKILLDLCRTRYSGALDLARGKTAKRIVFQRGAPVLSESNLANETLGAQLMDQGLITRADHLRVSSYMDREQCKEGVALLALELLEPKGLFLALKEQLRRRMLEIFAWSSGRYQLEAVADLKSEVQPFRSDPLSLVREGLVSHWTPDRLLADLREQIECFPKRTPSYDGAAQRLADHDEIAALLQRMDGRQTLGRAIGNQFNSPMALATLWILATGRYIRFSTTALYSEGEKNPAENLEAEIEIEVIGQDQNPGKAPTTGLKSSEALNSADNKKQDLTASMRSEVLERYENIEKYSFYELLGIAEDAKDNEVRKAYFAAAKRFHPDALNHLGLSDIKQQAAVVFARIAEANDVLRDSAKRAEYDDRCLNADEPAVDTHTLAQAETFFRKGEILIRMGDFRGALEYLESAVNLWPDECDYQSGLGWALYKQPTAELEASLVHLERAAQLDPTQAVNLFRLGMVLRASGKTNRAAECLAQAKQLDPGVS